ncbi:hypothetical protein [Actinomadura decatromicini]|uniref:Uncharacterized protein n=1 Tax=Actinomadura decatromicini TaxID=2604572 RepID=A0A5D3FJ83_9ACTN|nr:hypothetical protein [Actinomadura decatromicini]TYK47295.1 hypothetical protein FXF68_26265 [Actinomadura decatromicini]
MVQLLQGRPHTLDRTNRAVRRQINDQAADIEFADLWRDGGNVIPPTGRNPVRIDNQGTGFDVVDNVGTNYGRGRQLAAKGGNATYAVVCVADSLNSDDRDDDPRRRADSVTAAVQNALRLSASSDPGCVYIIVP